MLNYLRNFFCCLKSNNDIFKRTYSHNINYSTCINQECECSKLGPPAWGTCDVCGAWKNY